MTRVGVVGAGYVGLVTAVCLARSGHRVYCCDLDAAKVDKLVAGESPIHEPGLAEALAAGCASGNLTFGLGTAEVANNDVVFICVQTPSLPDGSTDASAVEAAILEIAPRMPSGAVLVNKSTSPVGTTRRLEALIARHDLALVTNPEFLSQGTAVADFVQPNRIVVGGTDRAACERVVDLHRPTTAAIVVTDPESAELIKYGANSFLAMKLSFVNTMAALCDATGADAVDVMFGIGSDPRIGHTYMKPGPGWGGSCLPKDARALVHTAETVGVEFGLVRQAIISNDQQIERVVQAICAKVDGPVAQATVALLGLSFKANTDDVRDSPAVGVCERLVDRGVAVRAYDPHARWDPSARWAGGQVVRCADPYEAATGASVTAVLTEWPEFAHLDFAKLADLMVTPRLVDTRAVLDPVAVRRLGFDVTSFGRK